MSGRKIIDKLGDRYGKLVVIEYFGKVKRGKRNRHYWKCLCDCGIETIVRTSELKSGHTNSCGCLRRPNRHGKRYGKLIVLEYVGSTERGSSIWTVLCDCGNVINLPWDTIRYHRNQHCGCIKPYKRTKLTSQELGINALYSQYKNRSIRIKCDFNLTKEEFEILTNGNCYYCGALPSMIIHGYTYNGIDRLDNSIGYYPTNSCTCCWPCNKMKGSRNEDEFLYHIAKIHLNSELSPPVTR